MSLYKSAISKLKQIATKNRDAVLCMAAAAIMIVALCVGGLATNDENLQADRTDFDKNTHEANYKDVRVLYKLKDGWELKVCLLTEEVNVDGTEVFHELKEGMDYTVEDGEVVLKKEYLATVVDGQQTFYFVSSEIPEEENHFEVVESLSNEIEETFFNEIEETGSNEVGETISNEIEETGFGEVEEADFKEAVEMDDTMQTRIPEVIEEKLVLHIRTTEERETFTTESIAPKDSEAAPSEEQEEQLPLTKSTGAGRSGENYSVGLKWATTDMSQLYDMVWSGTDFSSLSFTASLTISTRAAEYAAGEMEIRMPYTIMYDRRGNAIHPTSIGIPQAPSVAGGDGAPFHYSIDTVTDEIVITNFSTVHSSTNFVIQFSYTGLYPINMIDMNKGVLQAVAAARNTEGIIETEISNEITLTFDTSIEVKNVVKTKASFLYYWDTSIFSGEKPDDFEEYCYIIYRIGTTFSGNQNAQITYTEDPGNGGELVLAYVKSNPNINIVSYENNIITCTLLSSDNMSLALSPHFWVVVRYPKEEVEAANKQVTNAVKVEAVPIDGVDESTTAEASVTTTWSDYKFVYNGAVSKIAKSADQNTVKKLLFLKKGSNITLPSWVSKTHVYGYNYDSYSFEWIDDFMDWKPDGGSLVQMNDDDYCHKKLSVSLTNYLTDKKTGQNLYHTKGDPDAGEIKIWGLISGAEDYQLLETVLVSDLCYKDGTSYTSPAKKFNLPEGTYRVKVTGTGLNDFSYLVTELYTDVLGESPTFQQWLTEEENISSIGIENYAAIKVYDQNDNFLNPAVSGSQRDLDTYEAYLLRASGAVSVTDLEGVASSGKIAADVVNDATKRQATVMFGLYAFDYYSGLSSTSDVNVLIEMGVDLSREEMTFYDLLPMGMYYDETYGAEGYDIKGLAANVRVDVETIDDYKGTGRQMVILKASTITDGNNVGESSSVYPKKSGANIVNTAAYYTYGSSGFHVRFRAAVKWEDVTVANGGRNLMVAQVPDSYKGTSGYADNGASSSYFTSILDTEGNSVFYDINGDGDVTTKNIRDGYVTIPVAVPISIAEGLSKYVKAAETSAAVGYQKEDLALIGSTYTYRLMLQNTDGGYMSEVVLFDILENAAESGEDSWQGTFKSLNTVYATISGIRPMVYYTTVSGLAYEDFYATGNDYDDIFNMLENSGIWTAVMPVDKSTITAIAVDLSKAADDSDYFFEPSAGTSILITMDAPEELQEEVYVYNNSAFYSTFKPLTGGVPDSTFLTGVRTTVELGCEPLFLKSSDPGGGENEADATVVQAGEVITYTLTYNPGCATENIVLQDSIPDGMSLVTGSITYALLDGGTISVDDTDRNYFNPETGTITWPVYSQDRAGEAVFTFQVLVEGTAETHVYYANQATAAIDGNTPETSNTVTHEQIKPLAEINKTAALIDNLDFIEENPAIDGDAQAEDAGTAAIPVETGLGQIVEYHIVVTNTGGIGGRYIITDHVPEGTIYINDSITGIFRESLQNEEEEASAYIPSGTVTFSETGGIVTWTLEGMADGEEAYLTFRVLAPSGTDIPETEFYELKKVFTNTAHLQDVHLSGLKYESEITVYTEDGTTMTYEAGSHIYGEEEYEKDSNTTYHQVTEELCSLAISKELTEPSDEAQQFVFKIEYTRESGTRITFYQTITVPAGAVSAFVTLINLPPGTYTITELESNWRYSLDISDTPVKTITLEDPKESYGVSFLNQKTSDIWISGKVSVTNILPELYLPELEN